MKISTLFSILSMMLLNGCNEKMDRKSIIADPSEIINSIGIISSTKVFFGHASVGNNIVTGLEALSSEYESMNIIEFKDDYNAVENGFYHKNCGKNYFPKSKCDAFINFLTTNNADEKFDIAFFKFCFVDIGKDTDIHALLNYYSATITEIKDDFPNLKIIHVTTPLTTHVWGLKGMIKSMIKRDVGNVKRNQYNQLLIEKYENAEPIFDLAKIESTLPNGDRSTFEYKGKIYYSLYNQYSNDGGHLNEIGSRLAAKELLNVLACSVE